jgi:4-carboxymuconolactone decarboxylase
VDNRIAREALQQGSDAMTDDGSYEARHERALDVYRTLRADASLDLPQVTAGIESMMGAIGSFSIDHVLGDVWSRPGLARRDRSLVSVTALTCLSADLELRTHLSGALNHGVEREELEEMMLHISAYAGFPRALDGMRIALALFQEREDVERPLPRPAAERKSDARRRDDGLEVFDRLTGGMLPPGQVAGMMEEQLGALGRFGLEHLFGEIWARPELGRRDRSLVTLVVLITLGRLPELRVHVPGALRHGLTREEIAEIILQLSLYVGYPLAVEAERAAREILRDVDERERRA